MGFIHPLPVSSSGPARVGGGGGVSKNCIDSGWKLSRDGLLGALWEGNPSGLLTHERFWGEACCPLEVASEG